MSLRFKKILIFTLLSIVIGTSTANAQLLQDSVTMQLIKKNIDCIYNQQFNDANVIYLQIRKSDPEHPVLSLLKGLQTYWENYPMLATSPARTKFEKELRQCIQLSKKNNKPGTEAEYLLYNLSARGMLMNYYNENSMTMDVIPLASGIFEYLNKSFDFTKECIDLNYFTGVYNYYREAYPNNYPVYKPLVFLFPHGNEKKGIKELQYAASSSVVLRAESGYVLSSIYLNFENNYTQALKYSKLLHDSYPNNMLYVASYIKNLLIVKQYNEAEKQIYASQKVIANKYFQTQLLIFKGVIQEKKYRNYDLAKQYYTVGIKKISDYGDLGNDFSAFAYYGLSRISTLKDDTNAGKQYREIARKLATFDNVNIN